MDAGNIPYELISHLPNVLMFGWRDKTSNFKLRNGFTCLITT